MQYSQLRSKSLVVALALFVLIGLSGCGPSEKERALNSTATVIANGYDNLATSVGELNSRAEQFCSAPDQSKLDQTRTAWVKAMDAWMRIQAINFGPIRSLDLAYKIQFWPDPRDMVGSELQTQIAQASTDAAAMKAKIDKASVAVHGLPAIEALLYPEENDALALFQQPGRCQVLNAVSANLLDSSDQLQSAWTAPDTGLALRFTNFAEDVSLFRDADAAVSGVLSGMVQAMEQVNGSKLGWPLGVRADGVPQPYRVESRRSLRSLENIEANLKGLETLFTAGEQFGMEDYLRTLDGGDALADEVLAQFHLAEQQAADLKPLFPALRAGGDLTAYRELLTTTGVLTELLGEKVSAKFGVSGGLNFNDGD